MGASPSREAHERGLAKRSSVGNSKRNEVILIPLTKKYFPSHDCPLFQQFYHARSEPAVKYYFRCPTTPGDLSRIPELEYASQQSLYHGLIDRTEAMLFDTDAEMLEAHKNPVSSGEKNARSVLPILCAVAFRYESNHAPNIPGDVHVVDGSLVNVVGCFGFIPMEDVAAPSKGGVTAAEKALSGIVFVTKSAGEQNLSRVVFAAASTYVRQCCEAGMTESPLETLTFSTLLTNVPVLSFLHEMRCRWKHLGINTEEVEMWIDRNDMMHCRINRTLAEQCCQLMAERPEAILARLPSINNEDITWQYRGLVGRSNPPPLPGSSSNAAATANITRDLYLMSDEVIGDCKEGDILRYDENSNEWVSDNSIALESVIIATMRQNCKEAREAPASDPRWVVDTLSPQSGAALVNGTADRQLVHEDCFYIYNFTCDGKTYFHGTIPNFANPNKRQSRDQCQLDLASLRETRGSTATSTAYTSSALMKGSNCSGSASLSVSGAAVDPANSSSSHAEDEDRDSEPSDNLADMPPTYSVPPSLSSTLFSIVPTHGADQCNEKAAPLAVVATAAKRLVESFYMYATGSTQGIWARNKKTYNSESGSATCPTSTSSVPTATTSMTTTISDERSSMAPMPFNSTMMLDTTMLAPPGTLTAIPSVSPSVPSSSMQYHYGAYSSPTSYYPFQSTMSPTTANPVPCATLAPPPPPYALHMVQSSNTTTATSSPMAATRNLNQLQNVQSPDLCSPRSMNFPRQAASPSASTTVTLPPPPYAVTPTKATTTASLVPSTGVDAMEHATTSTSTITTTPDSCSAARIKKSVGANRFVWDWRGWSAKTTSTETQIQQE